MMRDALVGRPRTLSLRNEVVASPMQSDGHVKRELPPYFQALDARRTLILFFINLVSNE
jgi:hypothetical protein